MPSGPLSGLSGLSAKDAGLVGRMRIAAMGIGAAVVQAEVTPERLGAIARAHVALQAQELTSGQSSLGVRAGATPAAIEAAILAGAITRTWPMRGTLHWVAADQAGWLTRAMARRHLESGALATRQQRLGLTQSVQDRARELLEAALADGAPVSRSALLTALDDGGISPKDGRGYHLLTTFCMTGWLTQGPAIGKEQSFLPLSQLAPRQQVVSDDEAGARIAQAFFTSHAAATVADLAGWSGQTLTWARASVAACGDALTAVELAGRTRIVPSAWLGRDPEDLAPQHDPLLLPGFDEFILGFKDRSDVLTAADERALCPGGNGVFRNTAIVDGRVVGLWARASTTKRLTISLEPLTRLSARVRKALAESAAAEAERRGLDIAFTMVEAGAATSAVASTNGG